MLRVHLRVDDPRSAIPRWSVECGPEVEEEDGRYAASIQRPALVVCGILDLDVCGNVPHAKRATGSTEHEKLRASEAVDEPEEPDECENRFDLGSQC